MSHVTCFTESLGGGGAEHQMVILAGMLAENGYDVSLVTYASLPDFYEIPHGVMRIDIGAVRIKGRRMKSFVRFLKCFHYFLWVKTDCVISYRQCANLRVLPPMFLRSRKRIRVICSDRNTSLFVSFRHKLLLNGLYRRADFIVPNSQTETAFIARYKPQLKTKLRTIPNYTDLLQFSVSDLPSDLSVIRIAIFSRFSSQKNPIGLVKAMHELKQKTDRAFEVHWYGNQKGEINGFNTEYLYLQKAVEGLGVNDVVVLHAAVKNPALLMNDYHAVCLPSLYEGFSNSIAEGICSGKPMLVSDVSDNSVMVHEGENGFLFDPKDTDSICNAFLQFFTLSYDEMLNMASKSRMIAESLFGKRHFIKQYMELIDKEQ